ncbi:cytidylyltransferase domain-containing protein [Chromobacterium haemolyticum]|uniref:acylneuraminate cytidylyltransferase family protein n=1 Tax=Chromobacterium haemolyticum TaxID=394935 RepID=UPI001747C8E6|nr:acylneuraminate cytidylyltransferase family protein [Chromobacterium haemolyticum]QOD82917.1 acylneuraminate cytidylyltransferase family protein [Chromobacterium haemolyticum]
MISGQSVLAVIPARGGSKGVPGKNIRLVGGKPLIAWSIEAAKGARFVDRVILSSDDSKIINTALQYGCEVPFIRDTALALDDTATIEVVLDAITRCSGYDWVLLLQPTSPLRTAEDIDNAIQHCIRLNAPSCVSVCEVKESPYWMFTLNKDKQLLPLLPEAQPTRRQDLPTVHTLNGAIYLARTDWLKQHRKFIAHDTIAYEMPAEHSIDLDTESDFQQLKVILENQ